ncbi:MAG: hypothetical protein ABIP51_17350 [Bacteroidia bacterium]
MIKKIAAPIKPKHISSMANGQLIILKSIPKAPTRTKILQRKASEGSLYML